MQLKKIGLLSLLMVWMVSDATVLAQPSPEKTVQSVADRVVSALSRNKSRLSNKNAAYKIVRPIVTPFIDKTGMARSVLGRPDWNRMSGSQRTRFTNELTELVLRTYSRSLSEYENETVEVFPLRGGYRGQKRVKIKSMIRRSNGPDIPLHYRLSLYSNKWYIYDMTVEGVSLLRSFRAQFRDILAGNTYEGLITRMKEMNARKR